MVLLRRWEMPAWWRMSEGAGALSEPEPVSESRVGEVL